MLAAALAAAVIAAVGIDAAPAPAWPGDPDGTFASCGQKSIDITAGEPSEATGVLMDADGSAVVAGWVGPSALVARFTPTGTRAATERSSSPSTRRSAATTTSSCCS